MNRFLHSKKILQTESHLVSNDEGSFWCFCIRYLAKNQPQEQRKKIDYRETLDSISFFQRFAMMRLPLIYIDESGFAEDMSRIFWYAPTGMKCVGKHDSMSKRRTDVIGALTGDRLLTIATFDYSINADFFEAWLQQTLPPVLPNGAVVVMDNAIFHTSEWIQKAVEAAGCFLEYLPPYSPDLNPIEHKWAQAKALRRKLGCSNDELFQQPCL